MASPTIYFHKEQITFSIPTPRLLKKWLTDSAKNEGFIVEELNYIFCSDSYLLEINKEYLQHNYFTDIITFDNSEDPSAIQGDIFISVDRVKENAAGFGEPFEKELKRVMIHGLLHLMGYKDKTPKEKALMRRKEEDYLSLFHG